MSIEKAKVGLRSDFDFDYELFTPTCDLCGDMLDDEYDFYDAVEAKKAAGWRSKKIDGEWYDICPDCQEKMNRESAVNDFAGVVGGYKNGIS